MILEENIKLEMDDEWESEDVGSEEDLDEVYEDEDEEEEEKDDEDDDGFKEDE